MGTKRIWGFVAFLVVVLVASLWWWRPGQTYSPSVMVTLLHPAHRLDNFRNMTQVFPYRTVTASDTPYTFPSGAALTLPETFNHDGHTVLTDEFLSRTETTGLMVVQGGEQRFQQFYQGTDADHRLTSWSVAKSVVSTLLAMAHNDGAIHSLSDPVSFYIPELASSGWGPVPLEDLLRMASGIDFAEIYDQRFSDINMLFYRAFLLGQPMRDIIATRGSAEPSGQRFQYISPNTEILAWVIAEATGQSLSAYASEKLWQPLGMREAYWSVDGGGKELGFCCLNMVLEDYAKLGQLYLQQGQWQGQDLLPPTWVAEATKRPEPWLAAGHGYEERGYGYHVWVPRDPDGEYFFNGVWGQTVWVSEHHDVVIAKTSVDPDFRPHMAEVISFMRAVSAHAAASL